MKQAKSVLVDKTWSTRKMELLEYSLTRSLRKRRAIYNFEAEFISKYAQYKDYLKSEKELSKDIIKLC